MTPATRGTEGASCAPPNQPVLRRTSAMKEGSPQPGRGKWTQDKSAAYRRCRGLHDFLELGFVGVLQSLYNPLYIWMSSIHSKAR